MRFDDKILAKFSLCFGLAPEKCDCEDICKRAVCEIVGLKAEFSSNLIIHRTPSCFRQSVAFSWEAFRFIAANLYANFSRKFSSLFTYDDDDELRRLSDAMLRVIKPPFRLYRAVMNTINY